MIGQKFNHWTVLSEAPRSRFGQVRMHCRCDCGKERDKNRSDLLAGRAKSCGCERIKTLRNKHPGHSNYGKNPHPLYATWQSMKQRCLNPTNKGYRIYGARGVRVHKRWILSFEAFAEDMGPRPSPQHSIDRINNDGHYEPSNCRWATRAEQTRNSSQTKIDEATAALIKRMNLAGMRVIDIAAETGTTVPIVSGITRGRTWKDVQP